MRKAIAALLAAVFFLLPAGVVSSKMMPQLQEHKKRLVMMQTIMSDIALSDLDKASRDARALGEMVEKDTGSLQPSGLKDANVSLGKSIRMFSTAVEKKEHLAIIGSYSDILGSCYGCHTRYRDSK